MLNLENNKNTFFNDERKLSKLFNSIEEMIVIHETIFDEDGTPVDYKILDCNNAFTKITGIKKENAINKLASVVYKSKPPPYLQEFTEVVLTGKSKKINLHYEPIDKHFAVSVEPLDKTSFATITADITDIIKSDNEAKENEKKYRLLFESANDAILLMSDDKFISCNKKALELFQCDEADIVNQYPYYFSPEIQPDGKKSQDKAKELLASALRGKKLFFEWQHKTKSGILFDAEVSLNKLDFSDENLLQAIVRDVSDRKKYERALKASEERFRNLCNLLPQAIYETDPKGNITFINDSGLKQFGYSKEDLEKGINILKCIDEESRHNAINNINTILKNGFNQANEYIALKKDGSKFPILIFSDRIIEHEKLVGMRGIVVDISDIKNAQEEIKQLNESLELKVEKRTSELKDAILKLDDANTELNLMNESLLYESQKLIQLNDKLAVSEYQLKQANETKDKLFSIIAHDLKNPIGSIRNLLELIEVYKDTMDNDELLKMVSSAYKASSITYKMLEKLLSWSRLQRGKFEFKPDFHKFSDTIDHVISLLQNSADEKQISITNNTNPLYRGYFDFEFYNLILRNLVSNSIKYSHKNGKIEIKVEKCEIDETLYWQTKVQDDGVGINTETKNKLFKRDEKIHSKLGTNEEQGTGLGLMLCQDFVEKQGGTIWVESELGKGSTFYFTIPREEK